MSNNLRLGVSRYLLPLPPFIWQRQVRGEAAFDFTAAATPHHVVFSTGARGTYLTLPQAIYVTRVVQSALFAFPR